MDDVPRPRRGVFAGGLFNADPLAAVLRRQNAKAAAELASRRPLLAAAIRRRRKGQ